MKKLLASLMVLVMLCVYAAAFAESTAVTLDIMQAYPANDEFLTQFGEPAPEGQENLPVLLLKHKKHKKLQVTTLPATLKSSKLSAYSENDTVVSIKGTTLTGEKVGQTVVHVMRTNEPKAEQLVRVIVYKPASKIKIKASANHVEPGMSINLSAKVIPESANVQTVTWYSSDPSIATVDENGTVTGVKRGAVRITALADDGTGIKASVRIQVTRAMGVGDLIEEEPEVVETEDEDITQTQFNARLSDYDPTDNSVLVDILFRVTFLRTEAEAFKVGDTIQLSDEKVTIETIHADKDCICLNDLYYLDATEEGDYLAASYMSMPLYEVIESWTMEIPDGIKFIDNIDPENGQMLDAPVERTAADLRKMLQDIEGASFNADNVYITFDAEGNLASVERFYSPFQ